MRLPEWARKGATQVTVNGETVEASFEGSYVRVAKHWCCWRPTSMSDVHADPCTEAALEGGRCPGLRSPSNVARWFTASRRTTSTKV